MTEDEDEVSVEDRVREEGVVVFTQAWDSGGLGAGADEERVLEYAGAYWVDGSVEGVGQPFETLAAALAEGAGAITSATVEIDCDQLRTPDLLPLLPLMVDSTKSPIRINGEMWSVVDRKWVRALA